MGGLNVGIGGGVKLSGLSGGQSYPAPVSQVAYGAESSPSTPGTSSGVQAWHVQVGTAVAGVALLVFIRWSLPKGGGK